MSPFGDREEGDTRVAPTEELSNGAEWDCRRSCRFSRSIGQFFNRTHRICFTTFTAPLQKDGLSDSPSVAVKKLDRPALNGSLAGVRFDEPSRGGGVDGIASPVPSPAGTKEDSDRSAGLGGELKTPRFDARETIEIRDNRPDAGAAQAFGDGPDLVFRRSGMEKVELGEIEAEGGESGGIKLDVRVGPDERSAFVQHRTSNVQ